MVSLCHDDYISWNQLEESISRTKCGNCISKLTSVFYWSVYVIMIIFSWNRLMYIWQCYTCDILMRWMSAPSWHVKVSHWYVHSWGVVANHRCVTCWVFAWSPERQRTKACQMQANRLTRYLIQIISYDMYLITLLNY